MELLKLLSANELVAQVVSFLILLFILRRFAWGPFLKIIDNRKEHIASSLKKIEDTQAQVSKIRSDYEEKMRTIDDAAKLVTEEAISQAKTIAEGIRKKAENESQKIVENARETIHIELVKAKDELRETIVDLTIMATEKVIEEKLTEGADRKIVEDFVKKLEKA